MKMEVEIESGVWNGGVEV